MREKRIPVKAAKTLLSKLTQPGKQPRYLADRSGSVKYKIPAYLFAKFRAVLVAAAQGEDVAITQIHAELTTEEAAELLGVSRPYLAKLVDSGKIPGRMVGSHRRVRYRDLMAYRKRANAQRMKALDKLAELGQEMGVGY